MKNRYLGPVISLFLSTALTAQDPSTIKAQEAARAWLSLTDAGDYAKSWDEAAAFFRASITKVAWQNALASVRRPLGAMKTRKMKSATVAHSLPGVPDGSYVVIQFETSFEHKSSAIETVTPMQEPDGTWRVAGYYFR